jgi:hypothetical protein
MIFTKKDVQNLRENAFLTITTEQERAILKRFDTDPDDYHECSDQDIYEQVRKTIK